MAGSAEEAKNESDVTPPDSEEGKLGFDNDTLRAIVEVYKEDGNESYRKLDYYNAVNFYTEGINVKCKDDELNAKLYSNRATANFYQGSHVVETHAPDFTSRVNKPAQFEQITAQEFGVFKVLFSSSP